MVSVWRIDDSKVEPDIWKSVRGYCNGIGKVYCGLGPEWYQRS